MDKMTNVKFQCNIHVHVLAYAVKIKILMNKTMYDKMIYDKHRQCNIQFKKSKCRNNILKDIDKFCLLYLQVEGLPL